MFMWVSHGSSLGNSGFGDCCISEFRSLKVGDTEGLGLSLRLWPSLVEELLASEARTSLLPLSSPLWLSQLTRELGEIS